MAKLSKEKKTRGTYSFFCPGCKSRHVVWTKNEGYNHPIWWFNGSLEKPTFTPSILVSATYGDNHNKTICHSFVTYGMIQFLSDCTHTMAGQTVELPEIE